MISKAKKLKAKLHSKSGESLVETLISLLVSALGIAMLAGAISASGRMINRNRNQMDKYYASSVTSTSSGHTVELSFDSSIVTEGADRLTDSSDSTVKVDYDILNNGITSYKIYTKE